MTGIYRRMVVRSWSEGVFPKLTPLPPSGQSLALALSLSPLSTIIPGLASGGPGACLDVLRGWTPSDLDKCLAELQQHGAIGDLKETRAIFLPWLLDDATPESPNVIRAWKKRWVELPASDVKTKIDAHVRRFLHAYRGTKSKDGSDCGTWSWAWDPACDVGSLKPSADLPTTLNEAPGRVSARAPHPPPGAFPESGIRKQREEIRKSESDHIARKGEQEAGMRGETIGGNLDQEPFDPPGDDYAEAASSIRRRRVSGSDNPTGKQRTSDFESLAHIAQRMNTRSLT